MGKTDTRYVVLQAFHNLIILANQYTVIAVTQVKKAAKPRIKLNCISFNIFNETNLIY